MGGPLSCYVVAIALFHLVDGVAEADAPKDAILHIIQHFLGEFVAGEADLGIATLVFVVDVGTLYYTDNLVGIVVEQQRGAVIEAG